MRTEPVADGWFVVETMGAAARRPHVVASALGGSYVYDSAFMHPELRNP